MKRRERQIVRSNPTVQQLQFTSTGEPLIQFASHNIERQGDIFGADGFMRLGHDRRGDFVAFTLADDKATSGIAAHRLLKFYDDGTTRIAYKINPLNGVTDEDNPQEYLLMNDRLARSAFQRKLSHKQTEHLLPTLASIINLLHHGNQQVVEGQSGLQEQIHQDAMITMERILRNHMLNRENSLLQDLKVTSVDTEDIPASAQQNPATKTVVSLTDTHLNFPAQVVLRDEFVNDHSLIQIGLGEAESWTFDANTGYFVRSSDRHPLTAKMSAQLRSTCMAISEAIQKYSFERYSIKTAGLLQKVLDGLNKIIHAEYRTHRRSRMPLQREVMPIAAT